MAEGEGKKSGEQPIIIKKIKKGGHGHHGGAWKVAYADFVTAMMAFFIVMWILAASSTVKEQIESYFNDPGAFSYTTGKMAVPIDLGLKPLQGRKMGTEADMGGNSELEFNGMTQKQVEDLFNDLKEQAINDSISNMEQVKQVGQSLEKAIKEMIEQDVDEKQFLNAIKFAYEEQGLEIDLVEAKENLFFKSGSPELSEPSKKLLSKLAYELGKLPNNIDIEGHTDSKQYKNFYGYTNWELSSDRANAARRELEVRGLWAGQVSRVSGFADKKLLYPNNPFDDRNRRVSLFIKYLNTKELLDEYTNQYRQKRENPVDTNSTAQK